MVRAHLHRIDAKANMARFYCVDVGPTLFGEVSVFRTWGRIGTYGRMAIQTYATGAEAELAAGRTIRQKSRRQYAAVDLLRPECVGDVRS
jgi:predicted DNA-binding WGR domain protein